MEHTIGKKWRNKWANGYTIHLGYNLKIVVISWEKFDKEDNFTEITLEKLVGNTIYTLSGDIARDKERIQFSIDTYMQEAQFYIDKYTKTP